MTAPTELADLPAALTVKQAASLANVSTDALYEAIAADRCPWRVLRIGRTIRLSRAEVLASLGLAVRDVSAAG